MAIYFLNIKTFGRTSGSSAVAAAAYRAGERLRDERTGRIHDHTDRSDVLHKEILLPSRLADAAPEWTASREALWNAAEYAETRRNARVAREYLVALPAELGREQQIGLVRAFSQELAERYRFAVDLTLHAPRDFPGSDPRNFHAHLLATTREAEIEGLGAKTSLELGDRARRERGLEPAIQELLFARQRWLSVTNQALREAQRSARIEAGPIQDRPKLWIPRIAYEIERRGFRSEVAERLRAEHARAGAAAGIERTPASPAAEAAPRARPAVPTAARSMADIQQQAREAWLRLKQSPSLEAEKATGAASERDPRHASERELER